jgi:predicted transcriptional regulator
MYYTIKEKTPKEGQLVICRCPDWCDEGYQIATFEDNEFQFSGQSNDQFNDLVIAWTPLNEDGEQTDNIHSKNAKKYDELYDKILECYGKENENGEWIENEESDLCIIGEITAHHFGF